ncbi:AAA family ATPase [Agrobacterium vitis]|uniref:AAA family ATPase n=1 Tax=Rhizobium/Agrobacterium group TaxID=227290 RepID=UPI0012E8B1EE|nr:MULTISPECIES: AAA family ATPase [Rhizobium/Agrobacterium group]MCF1465036.1 AAA family ATPase [Allorhizobium ampelinum]MCF1494004.1 AAA family ATPase [Allorhizobium ampelinum]MVA46663.1 AAA family ATPase [Agrobacterium vitis]
MITEIEIADVATYPVTGERLTDLKKINYLFGHNGCGKTTISRAVHDPSICAGYTVSWRDGRELATLVFNRDFAEASFGDQMQGIFTLGEDSTRAAAEIERLSVEIAGFDNDIVNLRRNLMGEDGTGGREAELAAAHVALIEACWKSQIDHKDAFMDAFTGFRGKKSDFCAKLLAEAEGNVSELKTLDALTAEATIVFQDAAMLETAIAPISFDRLADLEASPILARSVVGRDDVIVAALIGRLGNSDWVKQGVAYLTEADGPCPFCQQPAPAGLLDGLNAFFDEQYEADLASIDLLAASYEQVVNAVLTRIDDLIATPHRFMDAADLSQLSSALKTAFELNIERITAKRKEPSGVIQLDATAELTVAIRALIATANEATEQYNATIRNLASAKSALTAQIWRFVVEERRTDLETYQTTASNLNRAIDGMRRSIGDKTTRRADLRRQLSAIEETTTSVRPTVDSINRILSQYGFSNFRLEVAGERDDMYRLVRLDGSNAAHSLSEGERSFITFLYFYHQLAGSTSTTGTVVEKVVVFDDPVSSLDADVLFVVSALIRKVISDVRQNIGNVRQVFVLTHNIYFHKEVSFDRDRGGRARPFETFWIVRKRENVSSVTHYDYNPVKTSYELLWDEVRNPDRPNLTIQNTMRRIVENYLTVLGGLKQDEIVALFDGRDAQICASLFSWINDGSHSSHDDIYVAVDDNAVQGYLSVFREVFERTGHGAHYRMMMRISADEPKSGRVAASHAGAAAAYTVASAGSAQRSEQPAAG